MLYTIGLAFAVLLVVFLLWQGRNVITAYRRANGTRWQRFLAAFSDSLTILWARIVAFVSAAAAFGVNFLPALDPQSGIGQALQAVLQPKYTPYYVLGIAVLFEVVRRRPGSVDPILPPAHKDV